MATRTARQFTMASFGWRLAIALALVLITYNPGGTSYFHWVRTAVAVEGAGLRPEHYLAAVVLIIGWVMFVRATLRSLGGVGILLAAAFFATLMWLLTYYEYVPVDSATAIVWLALLCLAALLAVGMSWSHIRRRLSGQLDVDDIDQE